MIVFYFINDPVAEINEQYNAADLNEILEEFYNLPEEKYALIGLVDDRRYKYRILYKDYDEYLAFITDDDGKDISFANL